MPVSRARRTGDAGAIWANLAFFSLYSRQPPPNALYRLMIFNCCMRRVRTERCYCAIKHTMGIKQRKVVIDAFLKTESGQLIGDLTGFNRALF